MRFLLNGAFFIYCICYLTKNIFSQTNQHFLLDYHASSGLSDESGRFNKKRQSNGRNFLFVLLPLIFVLILSMANLSWDEFSSQELVWQRDAQWKYSCICADASDRVSCGFTVEI